jgi:hypothetical protein
MSPKAEVKQFNLACFIQKGAEEGYLQQTICPKLATVANRLIPGVYSYRGTNRGADKTTKSPV